MSSAHPGFKGAQAQIEAKEGVSAKAAGRILGAGARKASAAAKRKNSRLKRVLHPPMHKQLAANLMKK
jgi:hypothetical protein